MAPLGGPPWTGPQLAQVIGQHDEGTILEALSLVFSQRPDLQGAILETLEHEPSQRFTGTIKSFNPEKRFGFIDCAEIKAEYGADVFLSDHEIGAFTVGSVVTFSVTLNKDSKPQAKLLEEAMGGHWVPAPVAQQLQQQPARKRPQAKLLEEAMGGHWAPEPVAQQLRQQAARKRPRAEPPWSPGIVEPQPIRLVHSVGPPWQPGRPAQLHGAALSPVGDPTRKRWVGTISKFFPDKHHGFIHSEELRSLFGGQDVFLSDKEIGCFEIGSEVIFSIELNQAGKPQARALEDAHAVTIDHGVGGRHVGTIKSFNFEKHFGFIQCDAIAATQGCDVFLSDKEVLSFGVGDQVSFSVTYNKNGKPQAHELQAS